MRYVEPARQSRQVRFSVRCGTIEKELGIANRNSSREFLDSPVCAAIPAAPVTSVYGKLLQMGGILTDVYMEIGGAKRAIRVEREGYTR